MFTFFKPDFKQVINRYRFRGYRCESGVTIFAWGGYLKIRLKSHKSHLFSKKSGVTLTFVADDDTARNK